MLENITPSTLDLTQFVSPNQSFVGEILQLHSDEASAFLETQNQWESWEDQEIVSLTLALTNPDETWVKPIQQAKEILSCPFLLNKFITKKDDILLARALGFDGVITSLPQESREKFLDWQNFATTLNMNLIPKIQNAADWEFIKDQNLRFIFIEKPFDFLQELESTQTWVIGTENVHEEQPVKCLIKNLY